MVENVSPSQAWQTLQADPDARLVDVRTDAEWAFVGTPDLSAAGREPVLIAWQTYPSMQVDPRFLDRLAEAGVAPEHKLFFICRTGGRSMAAAQAAAQAGYLHAYNVADGFEGTPDGDGHRGTVTGWKAEGLPWHQR